MHIDSGGAGNGIDLDDSVEVVVNEILGKRAAGWALQFLDPLFQIPDVVALIIQVLDVSYAIANYGQLPNYADKVTNYSNGMDAFCCWFV